MTTPRSLLLSLALLSCAGAQAEEQASTESNVSRESATPVGWVGWTRKAGTVSLLPKWSGEITAGESSKVILSAGSCKAGVATLDPLMPEDEEPVCQAKLAVSYRVNGKRSARSLGSFTISTDRPRGVSSVFTVPADAEEIELDLQMVADGTFRLTE